jgi:hypothetical protein
MPPRFWMEAKFDGPHWVLTDLGQGVPQTEGPCREQVVDQQALAILSGDHDRSK